MPGHGGPLYRVAHDIETTPGTSDLRETRGKLEVFYDLITHCHFGHIVCVGSVI